MQINEVLIKAVKSGASDIHLKVGLVPMARIHGVLGPISGFPEKITPPIMEQMAKAVINKGDVKKFMEEKQIDTAYSIAGLGRFRVNLFQQRGSLRMVLRAIPFNVPAIADLNLPPEINKIAQNERGLVLVTGTTGSGKSTTLAAIIDYINKTKKRHILTIEDPIEYLIADQQSIISQRELGVDTKSFALGLKAALRQDPDVILIGEMRDKETIETAIEAAETGHLVMSTLHTLDAAETVNRIISTYEPHQQDQVRRQLASTLKACISQRLARRSNGKGYIPAIEIMINTSRIKELIENPKRTSEIPTAIEESVGMQSFEQSLVSLVDKNYIDYEEGLRLTNNPDDFALKFSGIAGGGKGWTGMDKTNTNINIDQSGLSLEGSSPLLNKLRNKGGIKRVTGKPEEANQQNVANKLNPLYKIKNGSGS